MAKFAHIADTHIRNLKYHSEYRAVFKKLFESLIKNLVLMYLVSLIVATGLLLLIPIGLTWLFTTELYQIVRPTLGGLWKAVKMTFPYSTDTTSHF